RFVPRSPRWSANAWRHGIVLCAIFLPVAYNLLCFDPLKGELRKPGRLPMAQLTSTPARTLGFYLLGKWIEEGTPVEIRAPFDGAPLALVYQATREHAEKAIQGAVRAFGTTRKLPAFERQRVLRSIAQFLTSRKEDFARTIAQEAGKPLKAARTEVERAIFTF